MKINKLSKRKNTPEKTIPPSEYLMSKPFRFFFLKRFVAL